MKIVSKSLKETEEAANDFLKFLEKNKERRGAQVVGLLGDLGAGKTTFVQSITRILGIKDRVTSPTFTIEKIYQIPGHSNFHKLIHIDAYRLKSGEELMKLNFAEIAKDPENLILIEWPENVKSALPENYERIYFKFIDETTRQIEF